MIREQTLISGVLNCKGNYFEKRLSSENAIPYKSYGGEPSSSLHPRPTLARPPAGPYASLSVIYGFNWFLWPSRIEPPAYMAYHGPFCIPMAAHQTCYPAHKLNPGEVLHGYFIVQGLKGGRPGCANPNLSSWWIEGDLKEACDI